MDLEESLLSVVSNFPIEGTVRSIEKYGEGHINLTYLVVTDKKKYILQKINNIVFKDVDMLMGNMYKVTEHLKSRGVETLNIILTNNGETYLTDGDYRLTDYIEDTVVYQKNENGEIFKNVGEAFAIFQKHLADFDANDIVDTIPDFHNTPKRFADFKQAVDNDVCKRARLVESEIQFVLDRHKDFSIVTDAIASGEIPLRVTHNDTKLNNVLMDKKTGKCRAVIDLDTVMQGSLLYDFGDSIRFGASTAREDEKDLDKVHFDINLFKSFAEGFCKPLKNIFTKKEIELLPFSAYLMTMECGMRFLGDYLNGDTYFNINYPEHNLDRCRTQFKLAKEIWEKLSEMKSIVSNLLI